MTALVLSLPHLKPSALKLNTASITTGPRRKNWLTHLQPPLPEAHALGAAPPQVQQLQAVVTATAEQLAPVGAQVQGGDVTLSRKLLDTAHRPEERYIIT